jgi:hypothetical protein
MRLIRCSCSLSGEGVDRTCDFHHPKPPCEEVCEATGTDHSRTTADRIAARKWARRNHASPTRNRRSPKPHTPLAFSGWSAFRLCGTRPVARGVPRSIGQHVRAKIMPRIPRHLPKLRVPRRLPRRRTSTHLVLDPMPQRRRAQATRCSQRRDRSPHCRDPPPIWRGAARQRRGPSIHEQPALSYDWPQADEPYAFPEPSPPGHQKRPPAGRQPPRAPRASPT